MAPSRVWEISELISAIMSCLTVEDDIRGFTRSRLDVQTLSVCARVSKRVSEHALDALYHEGAHLEVILGLLCPLSFIEYNNSYAFIEPITAAHWKRFRHYSQRIRSLNLTTNSYYAFELTSKSAVDLLLSSPCGEAFLPCLRKLAWQQPTQDFSLFGDFQLGPPYILLFLHDGLRELQLTYPVYDTDIVLDYLPIRSPNLERLVLCRLDENPEEVEVHQKATLRAIQGLPLLRSLEISENLVTPTLMSEISMRPEIQVNLRGSDFRLH
ncbi:hypothetical protein SISSUDRAFT_734040 [Sistotremastrum suecicum HHB10207 ss-3]|uniref:F-box domain-containing protein n=1 Tax=Sistotremastrum suecicum HHB10207 ss-3 TaxID=1314776 RepID=A0A166DG83_9AGAM|nr:hypothetical protein SISSUDRAFT_734040 [Sistotremastrum suecicum HHB10207 ss-3]